MTDHKEENITRGRSGSASNDTSRRPVVPTLGFSKINQSSAPVVPPSTTASSGVNSDLEKKTAPSKEKPEKTTPRGRDRAESTDKGTTTPRRERAESLHTPKTSRNLKMGSTSVVCQEATLRGEVVIGSGSIIHPKCFISADAGPIELGDNNIIEELVLIINKNADDGKKEDGKKEDGKKEDGKKEDGKKEDEKKRY